MYSKFSLFFVLFFTVLFTNAQSVKVINGYTLQPVVSVMVYSLDESRHAVTDVNGEFDLSLFKTSDILLFQHASFENKLMPYAEIKNLKYQVLLEFKSVKLDEFVVSASKWEQNKNEVPNKIVSIDKESITLANPQTAADVLAASNEVFVQKSQLGGGSPMIRGFSANSVLLVVDGVRMNNAIYRSGNLQNVIALDPLSFETVEVIFGPGSIIYGSDALGGVMDFHTKAVQLSPLNEEVNDLNLFSRFSSANFERTIHADFNHAAGKWGAYSSITLSRFDDLRMGKGKYPEFDRLHFTERINGVDLIRNNENVNIQKQSGYDQYNLLQKFRYRPNNKVDLNYAFHLSSTSNVPRYDRLSQYSSGQLKYSDWYYGPQFWHMQSLNLKVRDSVQFYDHFQLTLAYQKVKESRHNRKFENEILTSRNENVSVYSFNLDFDKSLSKKNTLFYGIEALMNDVSSAALGKNVNTNEVAAASTRYPDGGSTYYSYAAYFSFKSNLSQHITINTGVRFNGVGLKSKFIDKSFFDFPFDEIKVDNQSFNGSFGLVYRPTKVSQLNFNLSSGFRAPNVDDIAKVFDSAPGNVIVPNQDLKPEKAINMDVGYIHSIKDIIHFDISMFYTNLTDVMVRRDFSFYGQTSIMYDGELSNVEAVVNGGKAKIYGMSFGLNVDLSPAMSLHTTHTLIKGEDDSDNALRHVPPIYGVLGLNYKPNNKLSMDLNLIYNGTITHENLAPSEQDKAYLYAVNENGNPYSPGWLTLNLKSSYQISDNALMNFGIENITNVRYRPYSSGISPPGRNFIISIHLNI